MPRKYVKRLGAYGKRNYDRAYLERALDAVRKGRLSLRKASEMFAVPYTTLNNTFHGKHPLIYGGQPALDEQSETLLVNALQTCAEWGFPLKPIDIRRITQQYLNKRGITEKRFNNNMPGEGWFNGLMKRHPRLTIKLAENTKRVRAAVTYEIIEDYFRNVSKIIEDIPAQNIVNYDETNFVDDPGAVKVVMKKGSKHAYRTLDTTKSSTTVMFAIAADGTRLPPYTVYKAKYLYEGWKEGGLPGAMYNRSPKGWFDSELFDDWFRSVALPFFRKLDGTKLLIGDNLQSHITVSVIEECENNDIRFILLPPNSTHMLQPLDVAYFRPLKASWKRVLEEWKLKNRGVLPKTVFPRMLKSAVEGLGEREMNNILAGFKACGLVPFNPDAVLAKIARKEPTTPEERNRAETSMTSALVDYLHQLKTGPSDAPKRGKRLNIAAGKSIGTKDLEEENPRSCKQSKTRKRQISDSEDENDLQTLEVEEQSVNIDDYEIGESSAEPEDIPDSSGGCDIGDFIITKYETNKRDRFYIAKIIEMTETELVVSTLRKHASNKSVFFSFPNILDESVINRQQIVRRVILKSLKRGKYYFSLGEELETLQ
uniref:DDE-1 domain-containing protein n=2 Tax=Photinus pyralis TaxID=7054 RepID=A0A1Y1K537_PHOPY